ncbi:MAG: thioredoxin domain-containing protein [Acidobacteriota bacterium]|nr:MAG: thioredoxin domain-containing protein [Acidobacteriota bacterium]
MANQTNTTASGEKKSNLAPFVIIGLIFVATIAGIYYITQTGDRSTGNTATNTAGNSNSGSQTAQPLANYATAPPGASPAHYKGSEGAPVIVEEFADFQCPTCAVVHPRMNEVVSRFGTKIKFVFRNYPLTTIHRNAYDASVAAEAAGFQNKFWEMQNLLFQNQSRWSTAPQPRPLFEEYATTLGLDVEKFKNDMAGFAAKGRVDEDMRRARALNLTGTPSILVNGKPVNGYETAIIAQAVETELARFEQSSESAAPAGEDKPAEAPANQNQ